jgi:osmotically-inducible protein OsmY
MLMLLVGGACSTTRPNNISYRDGVNKALQQAGLQNVTVDEDRNKNTITLRGIVSSDYAKLEAGELARAAAGDRIVVNQIGVQPKGGESGDEAIASNVDDTIEDNYKAALISSGLDREPIRFDAKNGVLTLRGNVRTAAQRRRAEQLAASVPNVRQVLSEVQVAR